MGEVVAYAISPFTVRHLRNVCWELAFDNARAVYHLPRKTLRFPDRIRIFASGPTSMGVVEQHRM